MVGSSIKTSSRRLQFWIAASMEGVGVVTTSPGEVNFCENRCRGGKLHTAEVESSGTRCRPCILLAVRPIYRCDVCRAIEALQLVYRLSLRHL